MVVVIFLKLVFFEEFHSINKYKDKPFMQQETCRLNSNMSIASITLLISLFYATRYLNFYQCHDYLGFQKHLVMIKIIIC